MKTNYEDPGFTKLTLTIDDVTTTWERPSHGCTFDELLYGFLGCMFGQTFVPGTEMEVFQHYLDEMENLYSKDKHNTGELYRLIFG